MADISNLETVASEACTKSGAFVLLLSLTLTSLIPAWNRRKKEKILGRYMGFRLTLTATIDALDENPVWEEYKRTHDTESVPLELLLSIQLGSSTLPSPASGSSVNPNLPPPRPGAPPPPTLAVSLFLGVDEIGRIVELMKELNDSDLLTRSRNASDLFNISIYRWLLRRDRMILRNKIKTGNMVVKLLESIEQSPGNSAHKTALSPRRQLPANFGPAVDENDLLKYLTLHDVRQLAEVELPPISNAVKLGRDDLHEVEVKTASLPRDLFGASVSLQCLLFFTIVYFGSFAREAVSATGFPSRGTLFGAFAGSHFALFVFVLALLTPLAASAGILRQSSGETSKLERLGLGICTLLIGLTVVWVYAVLNSGSYFHPLFKHVTRNY